MVKKEVEKAAEISYNTELPIYYGRVNGQIEEKMAKRFDAAGFPKGFLIPALKHFARIDFEAEFKHQKILSALRFEIEDKPMEANTLERL